MAKAIGKWHFSPIAKKVGLVSFFIALASMLVAIIPQTQINFSYFVTAGFIIFFIVAIILTLLYDAIANRMHFFLGQDFAIAIGVGISATTAPIIAQSTSASWQLFIAEFVIAMIYGTFATVLVKALVVSKK
jgi:hypothetical protein